MKTFTRISILALLAALPACNDGGLTNRTIPPIAGIVGGPDQPNGNGNVASWFMCAPRAAPLSHCPSRCTSQRG